MNPTQPEGNASIQLPSVKTQKQVIIARKYLAALSLCQFVQGWNDGSTGPLLPRIQRVYHVGFTVVSLIFAVGCVGLVLGALSNVYVTEKVNFGKILLIGSCCQLLAYVIQTCAPPFPLFVVSFFLAGVGSALTSSQATGFVAVYEDSPETKMGILLSVYGLGALSAPLVSTQFAQQTHWSFYYLTSLGLAITNSILIILVFQGRAQDGKSNCFADIGQKPSEKNNSGQSTFRQILSNKAIHLFAFFIWMYIGIEITFGGWIVTYIIDIRGGGPSTGYVSSGFFGGLTLGRVLLLWVNKKIGERRALFIYGVLVLGLEFVVWFVPSLIGNAVAVSIIGLLLGPMFPIAVNHTRRILPRYMLTGAIGWIAGFGEAGSAVLPFVTGAITSKFGMKSLQPLLVVMTVILLILWIAIPNKPLVISSKGDKEDGAVEVLDTASSEVKNNMV